MIHFVVTERGSWSVRFYLAEEGAALDGRLRVVTYEELARMSRLPLGTWVFSEFDQLDGAQRELAAHAWDRLLSCGASVRLVNDARRVRDRVDLLRAAHDAGINDFRVFPASAIFGTAGAASELRYPVFVRYANRHVGNLTPRLGSATALTAAVASLVGSRIRLDELLIVEFCDASDADGVFRKYSAYKVGDRIVPRYLECSRDWMVKWDYRLFDAQRAEEERRYLETNPHDSWIRDMFALARTDYGRIDYGVAGGGPQVWEINTNSTIGRPPGPKVPYLPHIAAYKEMLAPWFAEFYRQFREAWEAIDLPTPEDESVDLRLPRSLAQAVHRAERQRRRSERVGGLVHLIARQEWMKPLTRAAKRTFAAAAAAKLRRTADAGRGSSRPAN